MDIVDINTRQLFLSEHLKTRRHEIQLGGTGGTNQKSFFR